MVMHNRKKLENKRIFIDNDLTWKERKNKEKIRLSNEREGGAVKTGYAKIERNEEEWRWNEDEKLFRSEKTRNKRKEGEVAEGSKSDDAHME